MVDLMQDLSCTRTVTSLKILLRYERGHGWLRSRHALTWTVQV